MKNTEAMHDRTVVTSYKNHADAEAAVRRLAADGFPLDRLSIVGRNFESVEEVQGFYRPGDAVLEGAGQGAWFGGLFGLMLGALGIFFFPVVGSVLILGPLAGLVAGAVGGAGVGALLSGLVALGIPHDQALVYQERLQAGEFLVVLQASADEAARAHEILDNSLDTYLLTHAMAPEKPDDDSGSE